MTSADLSSEGEAAKPRNWGAVRSTLSPEGVSVSVVVGLAARDGVKTSESHSVVAG